MANNYYGIRIMHDNPLEADLKQKLSRLLFLDPDISAESAYSITKNYLQEEVADRFIQRMTTKLIMMEPREIEKGFFRKIRRWLHLHGFPNADEMIDFCVVADKEMADIVSYLKNLITDMPEIKPVKFRVFLYYYGSFMKIEEHDALLDKYSEVRDRHDGNREGKNVK